MQLNSLILTNYCQYKKKDISFPKGIIVLIGSNGSGKSNLLNAIFFALTGDSIISNKTRNKMLKWGALKGDVTLIFEVNGAHYNIVRNLHNSSVVLCGPNELQINKSREASLYIQELLGADSDILKITSFMPQVSTNKLIFGTAAERQKAFGRLFQLAHLEKGRTDLQKELAQIPFYEEVSADVEQIRTVLEQEKKAVIVKNKELEVLSDIIVKGVSKYNKYMSETSKISFTEYTTRVNTLQDSIAQISASIQKEQSQLDKIPGNVSISKELLDQSSEYARALNNLDKYVRSNADLDKVKHLLQETFKKVKYNSEKDLELASSSCRELNTALSIKVSELSKKIELGKLGKCGECGAEYIYTTEQQVALETELVAINKHKLIASQDLQEIDTTLNEVRKLNALISANELSSEQYRSQVVLDDAILKEFDIAAFEAKKEAMADNVNNDFARDELSRKIATQSRDLDAGKLNIQALQISGSKPKDFDESFLPTYSKQIQEESSKKQEIASINTSIKLHSELFLKYMKSQTKKQTTDIQREFLNRCREILHVDSYVKLASRVYKDALVVSINKYLELFNQEFSITINNELAFLGVFIDNAEVDAVELSGGQKGMLMVSCRLAISEMLSRDVGLLTFDEPGSAMDLEAKEGLCAAFSLSRNYLTRGSKQIIISSHDSKIETIAEAIINLDD